jgi:hypothetical protein
VGGAVILRVAVGVLLAVVLSGCGNDSATSTMPSTMAPAENLDAAVERLRTFIHATVDEVLSGRPAEPAESNGRQLCDSEVNDDVFESYSLFITVPPEELSLVLERTKRYWEGSGYEDIDPGSGVNIRFDVGYVVGISGFPEEGEVLLGGSTPCFPPA